MIGKRGRGIGKGGRGMGVDWEGAKSDFSDGPNGPSQVDNRCRSCLNYSSHTSMRT